MKKNFAGGLALLLLLCASCTTPTSAPQDGSSVPQKISGTTPLDWSRRLAESEMARKGDTLAWTPNGKAKWDYAAGLFELSLLKLSEATHDKRYEKFSETAVGSFIEPDGTIETYHRNEFQLDALNSGRTALERLLA
jgi:unsaturated rhamnogalacturonyl hydrolase